MSSSTAQALSRLTPHVLRLAALCGAAIAAVLLHSWTVERPWAAAAAVLLVAIAAVRPAPALLLTAAATPILSAAARSAGLQLLNASEALVLATCTGWLLRLAWRPRPPAPTPGGGPLTLFAAVVMASALVEVAKFGAEIAAQQFWPAVRLALRLYEVNWPNPAGAIRTAARLLEGLLLFQMVTALAAERAGVATRTLRAFAAGAIIAALVALGSLVSPSLATADPLVTALGLLRSTRIGEPFVDVNAAGSYFALATLVVAGLAAGRPKNASMFEPRGAGWLIASVVVAGGLWVSGSRAAVLAMLLVAATFAVLRRTGLRMLQALVPLALAGVLVAALFPNPIFDRSSVGALAIRLEFARVATRMVAAHPVFGVGVNNFYLGSERLIRDPAVKALYTRENAHNNYLQLLAELGVVGFLAFAWFLWAVGRHVVRHLRRTHDRASTGAALGLAAFLVTCLSGHPLLVTEVAIAFWIVLGAVAALTPAPPPRRSTALAAWGAVALIALTLPFRLIAAPRAIDLSDVAYGVSGWVTGPEGLQQRSIVDRGATLFVPADALAVELPYRLADDRAPVAVEIYLDGRLVDRIVASRPGWQTYRVLLPDSRSNRPYFPLTLRVAPRDRGRVLIGPIRAHHRPAG